MIEKTSGGLRQRVAAVTLLALGNGAPDIFSVQTSLAQGQTRLAIGALLGGCLIVTTVVVGLVVFKSGSEPPASAWEQCFAAPRRGEGASPA